MISRVSWFIKHWDIDSTDEAGQNRSICVQKKSLPEVVADHDPGCRVVFCRCDTEGRL